MITDNPFVWWAEQEEADARQALIEQKTKTETTWPFGCIKPSACSRHYRCVYYPNCRHMDRDISQEILDETARRAAGRGETMI